jgi:hypothetical protein
MYIFEIFSCRLITLRRKTGKGLDHVPHKEKRLPPRPAKATRDLDLLEDSLRKKRQQNSGRCSPTLVGVTMSGARMSSDTGMKTKLKRTITKRRLTAVLSSKLLFV